MVKKDIGFTIEVYASAAALEPADAALLEKARAVTALAYAPYSNFHVSAVARLKDGQEVIGTNQENASYPVALCAERVLLSAAATIHPGVGIDTMAISYKNIAGESDTPISPCGMCRQALAEYEERTAQPIRLILGGQQGEVFIIQSAKQLLPLTFTSGDLKK
ncbi:MAG TPA: cytidine deaminase [Ferruginibacter sp.]|nr:cytidine deaminase [Ferruginibacter sp.]HMP22198.1 cytidine deaminase [Ferruginibacter sp.]